MNINKIKDYLTTNALGEEYISVYILNDMIYPTGINNGNALLIREIPFHNTLDNEVSLARRILMDLKEKRHNAFAFYKLEQNFIKFCSLKI